MLDCTAPIMGVSYVESDFTIPCHTTKHTAHSVIAVGILLAYCFGFPAALFVALQRRYKQDRLRERDTMKLLSWVYDGYAPSRAGWEALVMARKLGVVVVASVLGGTASANAHQIYAGCLVYAFFLALHLWFRPYASAKQGAMETVSLVVSALSLYVGQLFSIGHLAPAVEAIAAGAVLLINVAFVVLCVVVVVVELRSKLGTAVQGSRRGTVVGRLRAYTAGWSSSAQASGASAADSDAVAPKRGKSKRGRRKKSANHDDDDDDDGIGEGVEMHGVGGKFRLHGRSAVDQVVFANPLKHSGSSVGAVTDSAGQADLGMRPAPPPAAADLGMPARDGAAATATGPASPSGRRRGSMEGGSQALSVSRADARMLRRARVTRASSHAARDVASPSPSPSPSGKGQGAAVKAAPPPPPPPPPGPPTRRGSAVARSQSRRNSSGGAAGASGHKGVTDAARGGSRAR